MASRNFHRAQALEPEVKSLFATVTIGASGAVTSTVSAGVATVAKSATGRYTVTLQDKYVRLLHVSVVHINATTEDLQWHVTAEDVANAKTIGLVAHDAATDTDPASGTKLLIKIDLKNTTAGE